MLGEFPRGSSRASCNTRERSSRIIAGFVRPLARERERWTELALPRRRSHVLRLAIRAIWPPHADEMHFGEQRLQLLKVAARRGMFKRLVFLIERMQRMKCLSDVLEGKRSFTTGQGRRKVILLHDNARSHIAKATRDQSLRCELFPHAEYSPDMAPSDYYLFCCRCSIIWLIHIS